MRVNLFIHWSFVLYVSVLPRFRLSTCRFCNHVYFIAKHNREMMIFFNINLILLPNPLPCYLIYFKVKLGNLVVVFVLHSSTLWNAQAANYPNNVMVCLVILSKEVAIYLTLPWTFPSSVLAAANFSQVRRCRFGSCFLIGVLYVHETHFIVHRNNQIPFSIQNNKSDLGLPKLEYSI